MNTTHTRDARERWRGASPGDVDVDEQFTESFTIPENSTGDLDYNVRGTYKVTYVP
jgi:hypothetical protein